MMVAKYQAREKKLRQIAVHEKKKCRKLQRRRAFDLEGHRTDLAMLRKQVSQVKLFSSFFMLIVFTFIGTYLYTNP